LLCFGWNSNLIHKIPCQVYIPMQIEVTLHAGNSCSHKKRDWMGEKHLEGSPTIKPILAINNSRLIPEKH